jgi:tripartite-type tricarboxylate transporter receptor subunit TctC
MTAITRRAVPLALVLALGLVATAVSSSSAQAQDGPGAFPTRPITLIVPFPAGGPSDALARAVAHAMADKLKGTVIVENIGGAGGTIGLGKVVSAPADGHTLGFGTIGTHVANVALYKSLPYDPLADFVPVGLAGTAPMLLVVKPALGVSNLRGFAAYAAANRATMTYGSAGVGSISHFACVILLSAMKQNVTHVPYRGIAPAMNDLIGGHIDFMCDQPTTALAQVTAGKVKAIAILSDDTLPQLPGLETVAKAGYPQVSFRSWSALFVPKGTPARIVERLNAALRAAVADPGLQAQMQAVGVDLPRGDDLAPAAVSKLIATGLAHDVPTLKALGASLD